MKKNKITKKTDPKTFVLNRYCLTIPAVGIPKEWTHYFQSQLESKNAELGHLIKYFIAGFERSNSKHQYEHFQCYIQLSRSSRITQIQKLFPAGGKFHVESQQKSNWNARNYCWKGQFREHASGHPEPSSQIFEYGVFSTGSGCRSDILRVKKCIDNGMEHYDIQQDPDNISVYARHGMWCKQYKNDRDERLSNIVNRPKLDVHVICGETAVGKTESIYKKFGFDNVYKLTNPKGDNKNWNGYFGQKILVIDDFQSWIKMNEMLQILQNKPYRCRKLNGYRLAQWNKVFITSNTTPEQWYRDEVENLKEAFYGRLDTCLYIERNCREETSGNTSAEVSKKSLSCKFLELPNRGRHCFKEYLNLNNFSVY